MTIKKTLATPDILLGQIHLPLIDGQLSVKCVIKKHFAYPFEFNETWWSFSIRSITTISPIFIEFKWITKKFL